MKSILIGAAAAAALFAAPAIAQAQDTSVYASAGIGMLEADDLKFALATFRVGANFTPMFGIEAEGSFGISGDKELGVDFDINHEFGAFLTLRKAISENGTIIGRVGYATAEVEASFGGVSVTQEESGVAFGIGVEGRITESKSIRLDWTRYQFDNEDADAIAVSFVHNF